jgi:hypothetical protein
MVYLSGILINLALGYLIIRLLTAGKLNPLLHILLALVLGLGIDGTTAFYTHILLNQFNRWLPIGLVLLAIIVSLQLKRGDLFKEIASSMKNSFNKSTAMGLAALSLLAIPLAVSAYHYPLGGWDAWSCWSLKRDLAFRPLGADRYGVVFHFSDGVSDRPAFQCNPVHKPIQRCPARPFSVVGIYVISSRRKIQPPSSKNIKHDFFRADELYQE